MTQQLHEYSLVSEGVKITVRPIYMDEESNEAEGSFVWAYHVKIHNQRGSGFWLRSRYWHITDGNGFVQEVRGNGVVGQEPYIEPEKSFDYASGVQLATASGIMHGHYIIEDKGGDKIRIVIPIFSLDSDEQRAKPN